MTCWPTRTRGSTIRFSCEHPLPADVVDAVVYLSDLSLFQAMNGEYRAFFQKDFPARATVAAGLVSAGAVVEIMVTAVKPLERTAGSQRD